MNNRQNEIMPLPIRKVIAVALRGIRIRIWRSLLVVSCIVLAIAFLTYILSADAFARHVTDRGSQLLIDRLVRNGLLDQANAANQRVQTYWMVGLALMISFVGIVNAMLMSVTERFREIGTMKCLGALDGFVLRLFLIESLFQGVAGTVSGLLTGLALAYGEGLTRYGTEVSRLVPPGELGILLGVCFIAGLVLTVLGALYPAYQAARMAPVMALRSEV
jgi:predicted lysophospholipase L1 biosynthesis ABC-type transport system permease subunit